MKLKRFLVVSLIVFFSLVILGTTLAQENSFTGYILAPDWNGEDVLTVAEPGRSCVFVREKNTVLYFFDTNQNLFKYYVLVTDEYYFFSSTQPVTINGREYVNVIASSYVSEGDGYSMGVYMPIEQAADSRLPSGVTLLDCLGSLP